MRADKRPQPCDVTVYSDKGSLALRFPKRHNPLWEQLDGKSLNGKPKCLGIGKYGYRDNPDDWKRATQIAIAFEADLDHPEWEKLFDPTLAKYGLGGGKYAKLAEVLQLPSTKEPEPEITVGEMWEAYLEWKKTVVEETTFKVRFGTFTNVIKGRVWLSRTHTHSQCESPLYGVQLTEKKLVLAALELITVHNKPHLVSTLEQAFDFCKTKGMLVNPTTENPFVLDKFSAPVVTTQQKYAPKIVNGEEKEWHEVLDEKTLESDRRAFTKDERDTIIKAFYESDKANERNAAPLIEFYFLTGCRTSEALALTWKDIDFERNLIRFSKSLGLSTKKLKDTKTGEVRLFYFSDNPRLKELLLKLKKESTNDLVFPAKNKKYFSYFSVVVSWRGQVCKKVLKDGIERTYRYPGVVTQLADEGKISGYLSCYHTRHTYITLTAEANKHNNNALLHIATSCGNSVDVILRHYLGVSEEARIIQV